MSANDGDWLGAGRLADKAMAGNKETAEKLKRMENTGLIEADDREKRDATNCVSKKPG